MVDENVSGADVARDIEQDMIDEAVEISSRLFDRVIEDWDDREDVDFCAIVFGLFTHAVHTLAAMGWKPEDLAKEALEHANQELIPDEGEAVN